MSDRPRVSKSRRSFLKSLPTAFVAGTAVTTTAAAALPPTDQPVQAPDVVTSDALGVAQELVGLGLPQAERESARSLVVRNRENYELIRRVSIPAETEPAFSFRLPRPNGNGSSRPNGVRAATPVATRRHARSRPAAIGDLAFESVATLASLIASRRISSTELTRMYLERLNRHDATLHCVVTLTEELALAQAAEADAEIRAGQYRGPLHGIPYGIKDLFAAKGVLTTWGAKPYSNQVLDYDSTAVVRLREAGAVLVAKLSTGELAIGDLWFRARTRNPWNPERGSNGSSAGPASATSAGLVGFAIGTETGGSIVSPASACGVVGLRPTYGRVSRHGCMTLRWTLDKVGPLTRSIGDAGIVLEALHGPDGKDETVADVPFRSSAARDVRGLRIGFVASEIHGSDGDERQTAAVRRPFYEAAMDLYRKAGATLVPVTYPELPASAIYGILNAEAGAMFDELVRTGAINDLADKGPNGRANQLRASRFIPAVEYIRAQRVRTLLLQRMNALFDTVDILLAPSQSDSVTMTNLTGHPAVVMPAGFVDDMPIAVMLTGKLWDEATILRAAAVFESGTDWHKRHPVL
jgi:Asp-tRNA(Asn)/Glu-tRNA(Gln) amidotransferase A subunit family amidase